MSVPAMRRAVARMMRLSVPELFASIGVFIRAKIGELAPVLEEIAFPLRRHELAESRIGAITEYEAASICGLRGAGETSARLFGDVATAETHQVAIQVFDPDEICMHTPILLVLIAGDVV